MTTKTRAKAQPVLPTASPGACRSHFVLSEETENQLWRARELLKTLAELALAVGPKRQVELQADTLATTLFMVAGLLELPMTYVPVHQSRT